MHKIVFPQSLAKLIKTKLKIVSNIVESQVNNVITFVTSKQNTKV